MRLESGRCLARVIWQAIDDWHDLHTRFAIYIITVWNLICIKVCEIHVYIVIWWDGDSPDRSKRMICAVINDVVHSMSKYVGGDGSVLGVAGISSPVFIKRIKGRKATTGTFSKWRTISYGSSEVGDCGLPKQGSYWRLLMIDLIFIPELQFRSSPVGTRIKE